ncbi:hypothetical protein CPB85DRAFT_1255229 [Mucidula mucida]|nr:hypothetical protein CPB85DRAFT_1255229 [Mucidula mucida]
MATQRFPNAMDRQMCALATLSTFITALVTLIASGVDVQSDSQTLDLVFSSHHHTIFKAVYELVTFKRQTPFALFHTVVFLDRVFSHVKFLDLSNKDPQGAEELILLLRVLFILALETTSGSISKPTITLPEKMNLVGLTTFADYLAIKRDIANNAVSPYTGTMQLSEEEWIDFHTDLVDLDLPIPCDMARRTFLHHARYTSPDGDVPLYQLLSPPGYNLSDHAASEHRPAVTKRAPPIRRPLPKPVLHLYQPQPRREIKIDLIELEAMAEIELVQVEASKGRDEAFWRSWLDRCLAA